MGLELGEPRPAPRALESTCPAVAADDAADGAEDIQDDSSDEELDEYEEDDVFEYEGTPPGGLVRPAADVDDIDGTDDLLAVGTPPTRSMLKSLARHKSGELARGVASVSAVRIGASARNRWRQALRRGNAKTSGT